MTTKQTEMIVHTYCRRCEKLTDQRVEWFYDSASAEAWFGTTCSGRSCGLTEVFSRIDANPMISRGRA